MKRKSKSSSFDVLRQRFPVVRLYKSDLQEIIEVATARGCKYHISDENYEYDSLDEVENNHGKRAFELSLNFSIEGEIFKSVNLDIDEDGITLRSNKDDSLVFLWHQIKDLIEKKIPWYDKFFSLYGWGCAALAILIFIPKESELVTKPPIYGVIWYGGLFFVAIMCIGTYVRKKINRGIYLKKQHEIPTFWERYGEKLLLLVLGTIFGIIGKILADHLAK